MATAPGGPGSDPGTSCGRPAPPSAPHRFVPAAAGAWCDLCCRFVVSQGLRCAGERPPTPRSLLSRPVPSCPCDTGWGLACFVGGNGAAVAASLPPGEVPRAAPRRGISFRWDARRAMVGISFTSQKATFLFCSRLPVSQTHLVLFLVLSSRRKEKVQQEKTFPR